MAGFTRFPRVTSSSASNLLCRGLGTTGTTTPLDLVRLVGAPLALVRLVGFFMAGLETKPEFVMARYGVFWWA